MDPVPRRRWRAVPPRKRHHAASRRQRAAARDRVRDETPCLEHAGIAPSSRHTYITSATPCRRAGASRCSTRATSARPTSLCGKNGARSLVLIRNRDRTDRAPSNSPSSAGARRGGLGHSDWHCISTVIQPFLPLAYHSSASSLMNDDRVQPPSCTSQAPGPLLWVLHYPHSFVNVRARGYALWRHAKSRRARPGRGDNSTARRYGCALRTSSARALTDLI